MTKKVIIIDDSITSLNLLKSKFADDMWEVYGSTGAKDAYDMIFDVTPDLIVTDAIMPFVGGFQFIKMLRENDIISKIPVIVYSVLPESNAKLYIKENCLEYFLSKNKDVNELINLANDLIIKHPLDEDYKVEILKSKFFNVKPVSEIKIPEKLNDYEFKIDKEKLEQKFKEIYNFTYSDEKIFSDFFELIYPILKYELCVVSPTLPAKEEKSIFFDIRDIIISPILQTDIAEKYLAEDIVLFKKYAPNLKMITNEDEFYSKVEFNFEYRDKIVANMAFYSKEKSKWDNEESLEELKDILYHFFKAYFVNKNNSVSQKENFSEKYFGEKFNILSKQDFSHKKENIYMGIVSISNYSELVNSMSKEELDILNLKISEKIMSCLESNEQVIKNDEDEYSVVIYVKDIKNVLNRFNFLISSLEQIQNNPKLEVFIGVSNCVIEGNYNILEAQKRAYEALEKTSSTEKTVINNATE